MLKRVVLIAAAFALALPGVALANGVNFGFYGGALAFGVGPNSGTTLTTNTAFGGYYSTLTFVGSIPAGVSASGSNMGDVNMTTGEYDTVNSTSTAAYFGTGGSFSVVSDVAIGTIPAGTTLFSGTFSDLTTASNLFGPVPTGVPSGTGAVWSTITCPPGIVQLGQSGQTCARLYGALTGTISPALLAWLGMGSAPGGATGWTANIDIIYSGSIYITHGDAQLFVPEPATLALFGTGLIGIAGLLRRKISGQ